MVAVLFREVLSYKVMLEHRLIGNKRECVHHEDTYGSTFQAEAAHAKDLRQLHRVLWRKNNEASLAEVKHIK